MSEECGPQDYRCVVWPLINPKGLPYEGFRTCPNHAAQAKRAAEVEASYEQVRGRFNNLQMELEMVKAEAAAWKKTLDDTERRCVAIELALVLAVARTEKVHLYHVGRGVFGCACVREAPEVGSVP